MGKCVIGAYMDSEGPDQPVHRAVWLQHSLYAYSILDTVAHIHIYVVQHKPLSDLAAS